MDARNANGDTPTLLAAARGNADVLSLLVDEHGASLDAADANGVGALHVACERRQSGVVYCDCVGAKPFVLFPLVMRGVRNRL